MSSEILAFLFFLLSGLPLEQRRALAKQLPPEVREAVVSQDDLILSEEQAKKEEGIQAYPENPSWEWIRSKIWGLSAALVIAAETIGITYLIKFLKDEKSQLALWSRVGELFQKEKLDELTYERFARLLGEMGLSVIFVRETTEETLRMLVDRERLLFFFLEATNPEERERYIFVKSINENDELECLDLSSTESRRESRTFQLPLEELLKKKKLLNFLVFLANEKSHLDSHPVIQKIICITCGLDPEKPFWESYVDHPENREPKNPPRG